MPSIDRRALLLLASASCATAALSGALRAEGGIAPLGATPASDAPLTIGSVTLRVRSLDRMAAFYGDLLGLSTISRDEASAAIGVNGVVLLHLERASEATAEPMRAAGLYHTAFLMPSREDLARWLVRVARERIPLTGFADHLVSEAVYLDDPEGNGIEVYSDRPVAEWRWNGGMVEMGSKPLDLDRLAILGGIAAPYGAAPTGLRIGHVHLRVGEVDTARDFYGSLGFEPTRRRDGAAFMSTGGYHHHLGLNSWQSAGAGRRREGALGLVRLDLRAKSGRALARLGGGVQTETADPWGTAVRITRASA